MHGALRESPVHLIIAELLGAVESLGLGVPPLFVERWGVALHQALASRAREFHTHQHALDLTTGGDPLEVIAALYHDTVYVQVDLGVPAHFATILDPFMDKEEGGWRVLQHAAMDPVAADVVAVFGRAPDDVLTPLTGLNELASALVVTKEFEGVMSRPQLLSLAAAIEATIPFRDADVSDTLNARLLRLGVGPDDAADMVRRAVRLSNNDVGNFAHPDPAYFLDNTWKLLPESNPALHLPSTYTVRDYRVALMKMEGFLSQLKPERVFRAWGGEPGTAEHARRISTARSNIGLAVRYLRCKLYTAALVEALAIESGGDGPVEFFVGGNAEGAGPTRRIEQFLPEVGTPVPGDRVLLDLLSSVRATASGFDNSPSPLATYLFVTMGEDTMMTGVEQARTVWRGDLTSRQFLALQPRAILKAVAGAAAKIAHTRSGALTSLMSLLG